MTPEMIDRARANARKGDFENVEFRLGEIEHLPVADNSVDVIISNCVVNLAPDKDRVFAEAFRVLKPGGRLQVSDIVLTAELPERLKESVSAYVGCLGGAIQKDAYMDAIKRAGFGQSEIANERPFRLDSVAGNSCCESGADQNGPTAEDLREFADLEFLSIDVLAVKA